MPFVGIIPARYKSTRLEGKPLADIAGKPMIQHVYERASQAIDDVFVATDNEEIAAVVRNFGGKAVMTFGEHTTGTSRCIEAFNNIALSHRKKYDGIINIQGDEPLLDPEQLRVLMQAFSPETEIATLALKVTNPDDLNNASECFVVMDSTKHALYFSRSVVPHVRGVDKSKWLEHHTFYKHVGIYLYSQDALKVFCEMPTSSLEKAESLEQNRWLEAGKKIVLAITTLESMPVDTPEDLERVRTFFKNNLKPSLK